MFLSLRLPAPAVQEVKVPPPLSAADSASRLMASLTVAPAPSSPAGVVIGPGGYPVGPTPSAAPRPVPARTATAASPGDAAPGMIVIPCTRCSQQMQCPIGAPAIRCPGCATVTCTSKCSHCPGSFIYPQVRRVFPSCAHNVPHGVNCFVQGTPRVQCPSCKVVNDIKA
jgi:hypothetical protein